MIERAFIARPHTSLDADLPTKATVLGWVTLQLRQSFKWSSALPYQHQWKMSFLVGKSGWHLCMSYHEHKSYFSCVLIGFKTLKTQYIFTNYCKMIIKQISVSTKIVLLEHSHDHSLIYFLWLLLC